MLRQFRCLAIPVAFMCWLDGVAQQVDTSFTLLWYKGKKLNDTTVLTPSGQRVTYNPHRGRIQTITPAPADVLRSWRTQLANNEQRKAEINRVILRAPHGVLRTGLAYHVNKVMDEVKDRAEELKENVLDVDPVSPAIAFGSVRGIPVYIIDNYHQVQSYLRSLGSNPIGQPPVPPSIDVDYCFPCDPGRQAAYKRDSAAFNEYTSQESEHVRKAISVMQYIDFLKSKSLPYDSVQGDKMAADMKNAMFRLIDRIGNKMLLAWTKYKDDVARIPFLTTRLFAFHRTAQLMALPLPTGFPGAHQMAEQGLVAAEKHLSKALNERDYRVLLNIEWIIGIYRTAELLGVDPGRFEHSVMQFLSINNFAVKVDIEATMEKGDVMQSAKMTGENFFGAIPDSNCVLKWTLLAPDSSKMKFTLEEIEMRTGGQKAVYTGTREWKSAPANLLLDFCKDERDTAMLYNFDPLNGQETWVIQGRQASLNGSVSGIFWACFTDVERLKKMAADPALQAKMMQQMKERYQQFMANNPGSKDPSQMTPKELEKLNEAMKAAGDITSIIYSASPFSFLCKERLRNKQKVVFDVKLNGKDLIPQNTAIQLAVLSVRIEHQPD